MKIKPIDAIKAEFAEVMRDFSASPAMQLLASSNLTVAHYKSYLRETYFYTRENPQIQAYATVYFRGGDRRLVKMFFRHASQEIGHDQLALNDLAALGEQTESIKHEYPLPSTIPLTAFAYYQIQHRSAVGYLGYLFFLEFMPTAAGRSYIDLLRIVGIPEGAMTFIRDHTEIDIAHNKLMEDYAATLIRTAADLQSVIYAMKVAGVLYAEMIYGAFKQADNPRDFGTDLSESDRTSTSSDLRAAE